MRTRQGNTDRDHIWDAASKRILWSVNGGPYAEIPPSEAEYLLQHSAFFLFLAPPIKLPVPEGYVERGVDIYLAETAHKPALVKIGQSKNARKRIAGLDGGGPVGVKLLGSFRGPLALEKQLHELFKFQRVRGEWFSYSENLKKVVAYAAARKGKYTTIEHVRHLLGEGPEPADLVELSEEQAAERDRLAYQEMDRTRNEITGYLERRMREPPEPEQTIGEESARLVRLQIMGIAMVRCREQPEMLKRVLGEVHQEVRQLADFGRNHPWRVFPSSRYSELTEILHRLSEEATHRLVTPDELYAREIRKIQEDLSKEN